MVALDQLLQQHLQASLKDISAIIFIIHCANFSKQEAKGEKSNRSVDKELFMKKNSIVVAGETHDPATYISQPEEYIYKIKVCRGI